MNTKATSLLSKVPEVTLYFWIIKILCTTVGETAADFLNVNLNFGLTGTSIVTGVLLLVALFFQFRTKKYVPSVYWLTVALISIFGTLVTDNLTDAMGIPLEISTIIFAILLAATFLVWYLNERTLSIHSILTTRREAFYWSTILFTFALGTAAGDLMAEGLGLGYLTTGLIVASLIAAIAVAWKLRLHSVLAFWLIYILTRPLGASIGDLLSQPASHGGIGLGATATSALFCTGILLIVTYLSLTKRDVIPSHRQVAEAKESGGMVQTGIIVALIILGGGLGYQLRQAALNVPMPTDAIPNVNGAPAASPLGDLSPFRTITQDTLDLVTAGEQADANTRVDDLEYAWDNAEATLKPKNRAAWTTVDDAIDKVLRELRSVSPDAVSETAALHALLDVLP